MMRVFIPLTLLVLFLIVATWTTVWYVQARKAKRKAEAQKKEWKNYR